MNRARIMQKAAKYVDAALKDAEMLKEVPGQMEEIVFPEEISPEELAAIERLLGIGSEYMQPLEKTGAISNNILYPSIGAIAGGVLTPAAMYALQNDAQKSESTWQDYLLASILGAGTGAGLTYAYNTPRVKQVKDNIKKYTKPNQSNSNSISNSNPKYTSDKSNSGVLKHITNVLKSSVKGRKKPDPSKVKLIKKS